MRAGDLRMHAVEMDNVTKRYGSHTAVDDLSLRVPVGSVYGFIGPNGSGKTTSLRMIMAILYPNEGAISVLGNAIAGKGAADDRVGYLPEERGLYRNITVRETLRFHARLKGHVNNKSDIESWLERMGLEEWGDKKIQALSKGMSQKVQIMAAVIARPELIILDEPFTGLDPVNTDLLRDIILDLRRDGTTIILSTHDMNVAEKMCDAIFMIFNGQKVLDGTMDKIQSDYGRDTLHVRVEGHDGPLDNIEGVTGVTDLGRYQEVRIAPGTDTQGILANLMQLGRVEHFELARPSLHDIFVRIAGPDGAAAMSQSAQTAGAGHE